MSLYAHDARVIDVEVTTTSGSKFTQEDTVAMARLVYKRFGMDKLAATEAWIRLLQITADPWEYQHEFYALVEGIEVPETKWRR